MDSAGPSEEKIDNVIEFASLNPYDDRFMVAQALKNNNYNVESVVIQFFDNPETFRQKYRTAWDDSMFTADRDGTDNHAGISFHIESSDNDVIQGITPPGDSYPSAAPSRPPSRSNNRSPLGRIADWSAANASGTVLSQSVNNPLTRSAVAPNSHAQEEDEMQRALRESAQEAGITLPTESTATEPSTSATYFGPANRNEYDQNSWAMVPAGPSKESSINEPAPAQRKRAPGAPALLVLSNVNAGDHKLGGILTVLHEIPIARNVLLGLGKPASSYGHCSGWWRGQEILSPELLSKMASDLSWENRKHDSTAFDEEVHRLMAFLDSTERGYGSVSVLTDLLVQAAGVGVEKQFYVLLSERHHDQIEPLMQIASLAKFHGDGVEDEDAKFGMLEIEHLRNEYSFIKTLYESLDHVMWSDTLGWDRIHEGSKMAFFKEMGEVLVLNIGGDGPENSIEIPEELYPEKYLTSRKEEARRIQYGWCETKQEMERILGEQNSIYRLWEDWDNGKFDDKRELIKKASEQWREYGDYLESLARFQAMEKSGFDTDKYPDYRAAPSDMDGETQEQHDKVAQVIRFSEQLLTDIEAKMKDLDAELVQIRAKQRALGRLLTVPDKPGRPRPMTCKKYLLRGVIASPNIVYVCQRREADLVELDGEDSKPADQWWRLAYEPNEEPAVKAEAIGIERVFHDMWLDTKTPTLVYATEEALKTPMEPLSSQLERFVKAENKTFRQELNQENSQGNETKRATFVDPISPSKRKHRSDSAGSMDSNRASIGSDDRSGFDNPFADQDDRIGTEMTDSAANPPEYVHSFDGFEEKSPVLPARPSEWEPMTESTSATMTPSTVGADHIKTSPVKDEPRSPEMQERARPPPFVALSRDPSATKKEPVDLMDMELPDHHE
ncbi:hypothetical protein FZEAL_7225 [Fusarium zealandicum]|uniref:Ubiquitin interaction domain-containing protein n=1 Tax=Fusarium zealandicum TaxID=1053134 RepID=A0A8H4UGC6_9HYPO|nr:hypothetical protein FZEAL_7225 [Fusarium zealandicum]